MIVPRRAIEPQVRKFVPKAKTDIGKLLPHSTTTTVIVDETNLLNKVPHINEDNTNTTERDQISHDYVPGMENIMPRDSSTPKNDTSDSVPIIPPVPISTNPLFTPPISRASIVPGKILPGGVRKFAPKPKFAPTSGGSTVLSQSQNNNNNESSTHIQEVNISDSQLLSSEKSVTVVDTLSSHQNTIGIVKNGIDSRKRGRDEIEPLLINTTATTTNNNNNDYVSSTRRNIRHEETTTMTMSVLSSSSSSSLTHVHPHPPTVGGPQHQHQHQHQLLLHTSAVLTPTLVHGPTDTHPTSTTSTSTPTTSTSQSMRGVSSSNSNKGRPRVKTGGGGGGGGVGVGLTRKAVVRKRTTSATTTSTTTGLSNRNKNKNRTGSRRYGSSNSSVHGYGDMDGGGLGIDGEGGIFGSTPCMSNKDTVPLLWRERHTVYLQNTGDGYGFHIKETGGWAKVASVKEGSGAVGKLLPGDIILNVNNVDAALVPFTKVVDALRKPLVRKPYLLSSSMFSTMATVEPTSAMDLARQQHLGREMVMNEMVCIRIARPPTTTATTTTPLTITTVVSSTNETVYRSRTAV
eukprot:gene9836-20453_t